MRSPAVIDNHSEIDLNTCIGPYTSIGDHTTIRNTETENTILEAPRLRKKDHGQPHRKKRQDHKPE